MATLEFAIPLAAMMVAAAFAAAVWQRHVTRPRPHSFAWGLGLSAYALASAIEAAVAWNGWTVPVYRVYFPLAATLVGLLAIGTVHLSSKRAGRAFTAFVALAFLVTAVGQLTVPLGPGTVVGEGADARPIAEWGTDLGGKAVPFPHPARVAFLLLNVVGGLALIGGALGSWWRSRRAGVLLIGLGALVPFTGGTLSTLGVPEARVLAQLAGIVVMFAGYLAATPATRAHAPDAAEAAHP